MTCAYIQQHRLSQRARTDRSDSKIKVYVHVTAVMVDTDS